MSIGEEPMIADLAVLAAWGVAGAIVAARRSDTEAEDGEEAPRRRRLRLA